MIEFRHFEERDKGVIKQFIESLQEYERAIIPELKAGSEIAHDYTLGLIDSVARKDGVLMLALFDEEPIGFACAWKETDDDFLLQDNEREHAYISDLFIDEKYRRKGFAGLLIAAIEAEMRQRNCKRIRICCKTTNHAALNCYLSSGFSAYETILSKPLNYGSNSESA